MVDARADGAARHLLCPVRAVGARVVPWQVGLVSGRHGAVRVGLVALPTDAHPHSTNMRVNQSGLQPLLKQGRCLCTSRERAPRRWACRGSRYRRRLCLPSPLLCLLRGSPRSSIIPVFPSSPPPYLPFPSLVLSLLCAAMTGEFCFLSSFPSAGLQGV